MPLPQVEVSAAGEIRLNGQVVSLAGLESSLIDAVNRRPETVVALRADASLRYQQIVAIFDAVKASGARLGLATRSAEEP
jgi:biopolymer transport protein ExbD